MRSWFQRFMSGRYGFDQLGGFLCIVSFILVIIGAWVSPVLYWLGLILLIYSYFRVLSRNRSKRYSENLKYLSVQNKVVDWANRYILRFKQRKQYRYFRCPQNGTCRRYGSNIFVSSYIHNPISINHQAITGLFIFPFHGSIPFWSRNLPLGSLLGIIAID